MKLFTAVVILLVGLSGLCHAADSNRRSVEQKLRFGKKLLYEKREKCDLGA